MGGEHGPYRQSERREIYREQVDRLLSAGQAYPCFCTDEELAAMKADAERRNLPPIYRGRWARASAEDVQAELDKVAPPAGPFRTCRSINSSPKSGPGERVSHPLAQQ